MVHLNKVPIFIVAILFVFGCQSVSDSDSNQVGAKGQLERPGTGQVKADFGQVVSAAEASVSAERSISLEGTPVAHHTKRRSAGDMIDANGNGVDDSTDIADGTSLDLNINGIPDEVDRMHVMKDGVIVHLSEESAQPAPETSPSDFQDHNRNGIPDSEDITTGTSQDKNANGIPDEAEKP